MPLERKDSIKDQTTTTGTGTITIAGVAPSGYRTFAAAHTTGSTVRYRISGPSNVEWEVGEGIWTSATNTLTRATVFASSNANALVNFSAGIKSVMTTATATDLDEFVTLSGAQTVSGKKLIAPTEHKVAMAANAVDLSLGSWYTKTIAGATTLTVSNVPASGTAASFILELTNGGSAAITWPTGTKWAGGLAPTLTAAGVDILAFYTHDAGTTWRGMVLSKDNK